MIAQLPDGQWLVFYQTNIGHAGEFIDSILEQRSTDAPQALVMSDALSHNKPSVRDVHWCLCNAHARRQFYDLQSRFGEQIDWVLGQYAKIWQHDEATAKMTSKQRLAYHRKHSLPVMETLRKWCQKQLKVNPKTGRAAVEENGALGKAMGYFLKHYDGLSAFCRIPGAPIDNNIAEVIVKRVVLNRKNAYFHQTLSGANIVDVVMSMIGCCEQAGVNVFDYFNHVQRYQLSPPEEIAQRHLPWNFQSPEAMRAAA